MAATSRHEAELKKKCLAVLQDKDSTLVEKFRAQCLMRGASGIKELGRTFRIIDDDRSGSLSFAEFKKGVRDFGLTAFSEEQIKQLYAEFDEDNSGSIDYEEFLVKMRPPMNNRRMDLINRAFARLDYDKSGEVTVHDLDGVYDVSKHPKYMSGELSKEEVLQEFLATFESSDSTDGIVTREEFISYYAGVSASIDSDAYFELMMNNAWRLNEKPQQKKVWKDAEGDDALLEKMPNGKLRNTAIIPKGGGDAAVWRNKLWNATAEVPASDKPAALENSRPWTGSYASKGIPPVTEVYKVDPHKKKPKTPRA